VKILITGSSGYIGSCLYEFLKKKFTVYGIDKVFPQLKKQKNFFKIDLANSKKTDDIVSFLKPSLIIHLAGQSTLDFIHNKKIYIENNLKVTKNILASVKKNNVKHLIFSSTAAVYKTSNKKLTEKSKLEPNNIYGKTKLSCEKYIQKLLDKKNKNFLIFRFFNVCSSQMSLKIGEMHNPETHYIPILAKKFKQNKKIYIYGNNFKTKDKTCIRDYIHIADILKAFLLGIKYLRKNKKSEIINLGSAKGYSNLEIFNRFKYLANNKFKKVHFKKKRPGDIDKLVCDSKKAYRILKWKSMNSNLSKIIKDEIKWLRFVEKNKIYRKTIY
jgi:UDP-glucose 4-epimerase